MLTHYEEQEGISGGQPQDLTPFHPCVQHTNRHMQDSPLHDATQVSASCVTLYPQRTSVKHNYS